MKTTQRTALDAFMERKVKIDQLLARLASLSADHFGADPETLNWGHVGDLTRIEKLLAEALGEAE